MGDILPAACRNHGANLPQDCIPVLSMDHAKQIVAPPGRFSRTAVTEGNERELLHHARAAVQLAVWEVPDHHGIGAITQTTVVYDDAIAFDISFPNQSADYGDDFSFIPTKFSSVPIGKV